MKNLAIFGASGMTGHCVLKAALAKGLKVRALLRDPNKLHDDYRNQVDIVEGDVLKIDDVNKTLIGQDAVIVVLGTRNDLSPTTDMSEGLKNIIAGMQSQNLRVVAVCLSAFLFYEPEKVPAMFHAINADHQKMLEALKASDLQWVAVFPPHIADQPPTGYITKHGESTGLRVISKYDLGQFFVDCIEIPEHYQKIIGIASNPQ